MYAARYMISPFGIPLNNMIGTLGPLLHPVRPQPAYERKHPVVETNGADNRQADTRIKCLFDTSMLAPPVKIDQWIAEFERQADEINNNVTFNGLESFCQGLYYRRDRID